MQHKRHALERRARNNVDDPAGFLLLEMGDYRLAAAHQAKDIYVEQPTPFFNINIFKSTRLNRREPSRSLHKAIQTSLFSQIALNHILHPVGPCNDGHPTYRLASVSFYRLDWSLR